MASSVICLLFALQLPFGSVATVLQETHEEPNRPVAQVISMLKEMMKTLEGDQKEDQEVYEAMACWCETNDKEKTQAISQGESTIRQLKSEIKSLTASSAKLGVEITKLSAEVSANQQALQQATQIRHTQNTEFLAAAADLNESITALTGAVAVLSKHHQAFLQEPASHARETAMLLQEHMRRHASLLKSVFTAPQRRAANAFVQRNLGDEPDYLSATPTHLQSYAPQSGEVYGILQQMLESFQANLAEEEEEEAEAQAAYEQVKAGKEAEIQAGQDMATSKTQEKANVDDRNAQAKLDLEDAEAALSADESYLAMLKRKCSMTDAEWEERQKTREDEMTAVSKALQVLSADDAHDTFGRTFNPSFLQVGGALQFPQARFKAASLLAHTADKTHNPKMSSLAAQVKLDNFTLVKAAINGMVEELLKEKQDEIKIKEYCDSEISANAQTTHTKQGEKATTESDIRTMESSMQQLSSDISTLDSEIADLHFQLKLAGEARTKENAEFQQTVADQRETQKLLRQAKTYLQKFYGKSDAAFLQQKQLALAPSGPAPPQGFEAYENHDSAGVLGLIDQILTDAKQMEDEATRAETEAESAYATFVQGTTDTINVKAKSKADKLVEKSRTEADLSDAYADHDSLVHELSLLSNYSAELHSECGYLIKNFDVRQTARDEEIAALDRAKAILSGVDEITD